MIGILIWLLMGAFVGWVASMMMGTREGILLNIVVGIVGAGLGGMLFRVFGLNGTNINQVFSLYSFAVSLIGAVVLLAAVNGLRRMAR